MKYTRSVLGNFFVLLSLTSFAVTPAALAQQASSAPGVVIPDRRPSAFNGKINESYVDSTADWPKSRQAPKGAPNVILVLLDDVGFGASSTFGGPVPTPTADRLAENGLKYTQFNTTALCSPTRACMLTGHTHHEEGFGVVSEGSTGFPGYNSIMPDSSVTIGEILKDNGYNTAWFGKNHNTPGSESSMAGPFIQWPNGMGFEYFYGFMGGDTDQWAPNAYENTTPIDPYLGKKNYNFMTDMTDHAITWVRNQKSVAPNKPFFMYFAPGATHAPHQPPKEWADKFKGQFDGGWNKVSQDTFNRMQQKGIIPADAKYNPLPDAVTSWDKLNPKEKTVYARMMEVYAGYLAYADEEVGRLLDSVDKLGVSDNTLVIYSLGDNGASAEGGFSGTLNEIAADLNSYRPDDVVEDAYKRIDEIGTRLTYNHYPVGWAMAMNTPFKYAKRTASHFGGTRNGLIMSWPDGIKSTGGIRSQFHYCNDIVPTILESAQVPQPKTVNGVEQKPMSGVSMYYTFDKANATTPSHKDTQYFEMLSTRALYHQGWVAATNHGVVPWGDPKSNPDFSHDVWELYNLNKDFTEHDDVSAQYPDKLAEMKALFTTEAKKYQVFPLDDRGAERLAVEGRPNGELEGVNHIVFYPGMTRLAEGSAPDMKSRSYKISADVNTKAGESPSGILLTQGGLFAGYALMVEDGTPEFVYNWNDKQITTIKSSAKLPVGKATIRFEFAYDNGGAGKGGTGTLFINDKQVASAHIEKTIPGRFSFSETMDVGQDTGTPVVRDYFDKMPYAYSSDLEQVVIDLEPRQAAEK